MRERKRSKGESPVPHQVLSPYIFRTRDGFLIGLNGDPKVSSPCAGCVEGWLKDRKVFVERTEFDDLRIRRDLLKELIEENCAHVLFEINRDGSYTRLDSLIFPHPNCQCNRANYIRPRKITRNTHFAFSPLLQIKCARFGMPEGNLWLTSATGEFPASGASCVAYGVGRDRETSRFSAVDEWLKKAAAPFVDKKAVSLQDGQAVLRNPTQTTGTVGVGKNEEEAALDALFRISQSRVVTGYAQNHKNPMLIVGANNWIRNQVPYFMLQQYDLHLLFYPNSMPNWVVGIAAVSRLTVEAKPIFVFGTHADINTALQRAIFKVLELCRPLELGDEVKSDSKEKQYRHVAKLNLWWTHWIYRCPKIALKDVLHLEAYPMTLEPWREFFRDGEPTVSVAQANTGLFPKGIRTLVHVGQARGGLERRIGNVNGIATFSAFENALL